MIFNEIYGAYYNVVSKILKIAVEGGISQIELRGIIEKYAYSESLLAIEPALKEERWQLLKTDGTTPLKHTPTMPLTDLQRRWLKAISLDPRIKLFDCDFSYLDDVEPLFTADDYYIFDKYSDGDDYNDSKYIKNFKIILGAVKTHQPLKIKITTRKGTISEVSVVPECLEYSEKDDKFRLVTSGNRFCKIINLGRIISCTYFYGSRSRGKSTPIVNDCCVTLTLSDYRNTLERAMLHFSHFRKEAVRLDENTYQLKIDYCKSDETELVIRILSFGPTVKVTEPEEFVNLIKERLKKQKTCGLF